MLGTNDDRESFMMMMMMSLSDGYGGEVDGVRNVGVS